MVQYEKYLSHFASELCEQVCGKPESILHISFQVVMKEAILCLC